MSDYLLRVDANILFITTCTSQVDNILIIQWNFVISFSDKEHLSNIYKPHAAVNESKNACFFHIIYSSSDNVCFYDAPSTAEEISSFPHLMVLDKRYSNLS